MNRAIPSLLLLLASVTGMQAQQNKRFHPNKGQQSTEQSFAVGIAPFSLLLPSGKINLRGEWAYADNKSLSLLIGVPRPTTIPGFLSDNLDLSDNEDVAKNRFKSFSAVLEQRFYLGQNALRGFYLAPYARYNSFSVERTMKGQYETTVKGTVGGFGLGASAGLQIRLGDYMTLDATVVGVDFKWLNGTLLYSSDNPDNDLVAFRDKIQETVGGIPVIGSRLSAEIDGNSVKVRTPGILAPGYRFNLSVNYVF
ncbi:MAG: DUF3575 domain-containing protein [Saprospiraceae bacterium]|nr:DUF3575 domain-containing protein [Saprospiraceae bacterium]